MANVDIGFALNYMYVTLVNITPEENTPTWAWVGPGITDLTNDRSEKTDENEDYSTGGNTETTVTGVTASTSVSGNRLIGDPFQDWLASIEECFGSERRTQRRIVSPTGEVIQDEITVKDIVVSGPNGAASDKQAISCTFARNDTPQLVSEAKGTHLPATVAADAVSVVVGSTESVKPTVTPATASDWCLYAIEDTSIARVTADGTVEGVKAGTTRLAIKCAAKPSVRVTVDVTVTAS
ncbi:MAG: Ig-like domain-containing protein [Eggerthellaceae bacterium]|nr:Ig-like domain-containing protein [Eggerthellaceae bacterium]